MTYDRGTLELKSSTPEHEAVKEIIAALTECLMEELAMDFQGGGSTTFRREALDRGLEPDECWWIARMDRLNVHERNPERVVEPDLAVEVEISASAVNRMGIYAALGVPEVWRWLPQEGGRLDAFALSSEGAYEAVDRSPTFPSLPLDAFERHVRLGIEMGQSKAVRAFRSWLRAGLPDSPPRQAT